MPVRIEDIQKNLKNLAAYLEELKELKGKDPELQLHIQEVVKKLNVLPLCEDKKIIRRLCLKESEENPRRKRKA